MWGNGMGKASIFLIAVATLYTSGNALAAQCNALLDHGLRNVQSKYGAMGSISMKYQRNCGKNFNSMSDEIIANAEVEVFGYGSLDGGFSRDSREQRLNEWCKENKDYAQSHKEESELSQTIYSEAVKAWESCQRMESKALQVVPLISNDSMRVDIGMRYTGGGQGIYFQGIKSKGFECEVIQQSYGAKAVKELEAAKDNKENILVKNQQLNISCERSPMESVQMGDQLYSHLQKGYISVYSAEETLQLTFDEVFDPSIPTANSVAIKKEISQLNAKNALTDAALNKLEVSNIKNEARILDQEKSNTYILANSSIGCPQKWSAVGLIGIIMPKDKYNSIHLGYGGDYDGGWRWTHPYLCKKD
jgi:hypothetical protein